MSSAVFATAPHFTIPCPSTAQLPLVCHRVPLSVGRFQISSFFPILYALHKPNGFKICQKDADPSPHAAYSCRESSTMMRTFSGFDDEEGRDADQRSVDSEEEWDTATKEIFGWVEAVFRRERKVFSATGKSSFTVRLEELRHNLSFLSIHTR